MSGHIYAKVGAARKGTPPARGKTIGRFVSLREAARLGRGAGRILLAGAAGEPGPLLDAVAAEPGLWAGVRLTGAFLPGVNARPLGALVPGGAVETIFAGDGLRDPDRTEFLPLHYTAFWDRLGRPGVVDLVAMAVPPPRDGTVGFGACADFAPAAIAAGARLIGIVNPAMPDLPGAPRLPLARFEALCEAEAPLPELTEPEPDATSLAIARHVVGLLRPGDTLQLGLGKLQTAILRVLAQGAPPGLAYHAGMVSSGMAAAIDAGTFPRGVTCGVALGDRAFYGRLPGLPLRLRPVGETHAIATLAALPGLVSVGSVLQIDLSGQANGEWLGRQISGHGGMVDFLRGARASAGGRGILALPSATPGGESRILPALPPGAPVSVARADVDLVVTEHGVADLREASLGERACRLAALAAPGHRDALLRAARGVL